jgi:hypothetical protein
MAEFGRRRRSEIFSDFLRFADVVNWWLADANFGSRWRLQELSDTGLKIGFMDSPVFGRRYAVFCGSIKLGTMEVQAGSDYARENTTVLATIQLMWVRLLEYDSLMAFFEAILLHIADDAKSEDAARRSIHQALTQSLWDSLVIRDDNLDGEIDWGNLEVTLQGRASWYFRRRDCEAFREMDAA